MLRKLPNTAVLTKDACALCFPAAIYALHPTDAMLKIIQIDERRRAVQAAFLFVSLVLLAPSSSLGFRSCTVVRKQQVTTITVWVEVTVILMYSSIDTSVKRVELSSSSHSSSLSALKHLYTISPIGGHISARMKSRYPRVTKAKSRKELLITLLRSLKRGLTTSIVLITHKYVVISRVMSAPNENTPNVLMTPNKKIVFDKVARRGIMFTKIPTIDTKKSAEFR